MPDPASITYRLGGALDVDAMARLYDASTLAERRPYDDPGRLARVLDGSDPVVTAWDGEHPVGIARCLSDFAYVTFVADLAVDRRYQRRGIGRALLAHVREAVPGTQLVLLAAPAARAYYARVGFARHDSAWTLEPHGPLA